MDPEQSNGEHMESALQNIIKTSDALQKVAILLSGTLP